MTHGHSREAGSQDHDSDGNHASEVHNQTGERDGRARLMSASRGSWQLGRYTDLPFLALMRRIPPLESPDLPRHAAVVAHPAPPPVARRPADNKHVRWNAVTNIGIGEQARMNRVPAEQRILDLAEQAIDTNTQARRLERELISELAEYCEERKIIRALDRLGLDAVWPAREMTQRRKRKEERRWEDDPEAA